MSVPPIDTPVGNFEVRCRVGQFVMDSDDEDRAPDLIAVGGTVTIEPDLRRPIRVQGETGPRVVGVDPLEFTIDPTTGKLIHPDGEPGVELIDPTDPHLDPQGWTYTANVRPEKGRPWTVTFGAPTDGGVVDLGGIVSVAPSPGVTENYMQQTVTARDEAETFAVRAETAATEAEDWAPSFVWDGTKLVIDGGTPVDLKGEKGDGSAWADLTGKPATYPSTIPEVDGLKAIIDRLTYDSGWRTLSGLLAMGWSGAVFIKRSGVTVEVLVSGIQRGEGAGVNVFVLPAGFRRNGPSSGLLRPLLTTAADPPVIDRTLLGLTTFQVLSTNGGGSPLYGSFTFTTVDPLPVTLPPLA